MAGQGRGEGGQNLRLGRGQGGRQGARAAGVADQAGQVLRGRGRGDGRAVLGRVPAHARCQKVRTLVDVIRHCFTADLVLLFVEPLYRVKWNGVGRWQQGSMEFHGRFLRGKFDLGVRTSPDMVCRGQWDDDLLHGHAVMTVPRTHDGVVVVTVSAGQFVRRHFEGLGVYRERDGGVDVVVDAGVFKVSNGLSLT
jgi:hypothetical protein